MGRHYSDSDDSYSSRRDSRKKRSRSRTRSSSRSSDGDYRSSRRSKKSSRRHRRSRSRSEEKRRRRRHNRRSHSRERRRSRSHSRSRSPGRHRRSKRSRSRDRHRRRSRSRSRSPSRRGKGDSRGSSEVKVEAGGMTGAQAEAQIQLALKAAAAADEKLKEAGLLPKGIGRSADELQLNLKEQQDRVLAIESIESEGFETAHFKSSRQEKATSSSLTAEATHHNAIFSALPLEIKQESAPITKIVGSIMHPNLSVPIEEKTERWRQKLIAMRNRKLEGEAM